MADACLVAPEGELDPLAQHLDVVLGRVPERDARLVFETIVGRNFRAASGQRVVLAVCALLDCASTTIGFITPDEYERWRSGHKRPDERPSVRFILSCFDGRWSSALNAAGLSLTPGLRSLQLSARHGPYSREEMLDAVREWLADSGTADTTFESYRRWAQEQVATRKRDRLPISAPTFRARFGSWREAVADALRAARLNAGRHAAQ